MLVVLRGSSGCLEPLEPANESARVAPNQLAFDENDGQWICGDKDTNCANYGGCDNVGIHSACVAPQTPVFSAFHNEWRCAWPYMDGWQ